MLLPKSKPIKAPKHLDWVRSLPCLICGGPAVCHHIIHGPNGGRLLKSDDRTVPLCPQHHNMGDDSVHMAGDENAWFARHGVTHHAVAGSLWRHSGDDNLGRFIALGGMAA